MAVRQLSADVARKIAAGEVIDRPNAIVRELMDNAVDSGANRIQVEIEGGGIEKIRIIDNGCGMTKEDLAACARPHATSKISTETDLLNLTTLGFRGEALASMAAVSRLQIMSGGWKMNASITEDHLLTPVAVTQGTIVQTSGLFENFPARRVFLKRPASEAIMCKTTFAEKALPRPDIAFMLTIDGQEKLNLPAGQSFSERFAACFSSYEYEKLFYEIKESSNDKRDNWSFTLIIGEPSVTRPTRKDIHIYVNGRKITEYALVQAIEYGCQGYFPNGLHPVACIFITIAPSLVDFNIHPAKKEARFKDISALHHGISSAVKNFFRQYTIKNLIQQDETPIPETKNFNFTEKIDFVATPKSEYKADFGMNIETNHGNNSDLNKTITSRYLSPKTRPYSAPLPKNYFSFEPNKDASIEGHVTKPNYLDNVSDKNFHFVGSALGTFLIAEKNDVLYIIDQHAAHERYLYNKIMEDAGQKQTLLVPYSIRTDSIADDNYLKEIQKDLEEAGFTGTNKEDGLWEFTTVPIRWKGTEADLKKDLLDRRINPHDMINVVAASTACRSAVMDGTVLDEKTAAWIAEEALKLPDPHCPHGRPVYTTITRKQLFELVKRI
ncbi:MAG: DNA mismatch repair endonuclease MutL [Treponema sp.]|nr:DNA mismatch repair endonuclease MutL [Treponema sp.]